MTLALQARMALPLPPEFDVRKSHIQVFLEPATRRFVKTVHPADRYKGLEALDAYYEAAELQAKTLWRGKYDAQMPEEVEVHWAETLFADAIPHEGRALTEAENAVVAKAREFGDFTLDMLWLMVEGLDWRPGKPVSEDDPGWLAIWAEEEDCTAYLDILRAVLGMPSIPFDGSAEDWMPPALVAATLPASS